MILVRLRPRCKQKTSAMAANRKPKKTPTQMPPTVSRDEAGPPEFEFVVSGNETVSLSQ